MVVHVDIRQNRISELQSSEPLKPAIRARHFFFLPFLLLSVAHYNWPSIRHIPIRGAPRVPEVISFTESCAMREIV